MTTKGMTYVNEFIADGQKASLSLKNFYDTILVGDVHNPDHMYRIPIGDFFTKYREQLITTIQWYNLPQIMFYKPKMVSMELYGTTELWLSLLRVNEMTNITEFHQPLIKVYNPDQVKELITIFFKREGKNT